LQWLLEEGAVLAEWAAERIASAQSAHSNDSLRDEDACADNSDADVDECAGYLLAGHVAFSYWSAAAGSSATTDSVRPRIIISIKLFEHSRFHRTATDRHRHRSQQMPLLLGGRTCA